MTTEDELAAQGAIQLAVRAEHLPPGGHVPSRSRECSRCHHEVLISEGAFPLADRLTIVCGECMGLPDPGS